MDVLRRENECNFDYVVRLVKGKADKIYDIDYSELFELAFNEKLASDESRKRYYGIKMLIPYLEDKKIESFSSEKVLNELDVKTMELYKEKVKIQDQRRELNKVLREVAREENIQQLIRDGIKELEVVKPMMYVEGNRGNSENEAVLLLSDWHYGIEVDSDLNRYNKGVFLKRLVQLRDEVIENAKMFNSKVLHVVALGDLVSGIIRISARIQNTENIISQTQFVSETLADMLFEFSRHFEVVKFYSVIGNHGRVTPNKEHALNLENFSLFIPWYLKTRMLKVDNVHIVESEDKEVSEFDVLGNKCLAVHGHNDKINNIVQELSLMKKVIPDYVFMAHLHHKIQDEIHGVEIIANPSLIGADNYSTSIRKTSKPCQRLIVFNKKGKKCMFDIDLD